jgi:hypothetical protein
MRCSLDNRPVYINEGYCDFSVPKVIPRRAAESTIESIMQCTLDSRSDRPLWIRPVSILSYTSDGKDNRVNWWLFRDVTRRRGLTFEPRQSIPTRRHWLPSAIPMFSHWWIDQGRRKSKRRNQKTWWRRQSSQQTSTRSSDSTSVVFWTYLCLAVGPSPVGHLDHQGSMCCPNSEYCASKACRWETRVWMD